MRIEIIAVGRARAGPERDLYDMYAGRVTWPVSLREVEEKKRLPAPKLKVRENELLAESIPRDAAVVALDEKGKSLSSADFAKQVGHWRDEGHGTLAFVIGGADGLTDNLRDRADLLLSFGKQTWPHMMVRAMLMEQIYRAQQILAGHPYHRG